MIFKKSSPSFSSLISLSVSGNFVKGHDEDEERPKRRETHTRTRTRAPLDYGPKEALPQTPLLFNHQHRFAYIRIPPLPQCWRMGGGVTPIYGESRSRKRNQAGFRLVSRWGLFGCYHRWPWSEWPPGTLVVIIEESQRSASNPQTTRGCQASSSSSPKAPPKTKEPFRFSKHFITNSTQFASSICPRKISTGTLASFGRFDSYL